MSDCSTKAWVVPGMSRLVIKFDDSSEKEIDYPFTVARKSVASVTVDGREFVDGDYLLTKNSKLCDEVNELQRRIDSIVRCGDCVHYKPYRTHQHGMMNRCHDEHGHTHKRDESDFCSRGERRSE